nr:zinc-ribbon domain-containing protein [Psychrobacter sp.]
MTTPIKTQCPHCHTIFNIKHTQLNQKTATVCCEHCQQIFLVNNNLIVTADIDNNRKLTDAEAYSDHDEQINTTTSHNTHSTLFTANADDADILIH